MTNWLAIFVHKQPGDQHGHDRNREKNLSASGNQVQFIHDQPMKILGYWGILETDTC